MTKFKVGQEIWWYDKSRRAVMSGSVDKIDAEYNYYTVGRLSVWVEDAFASRAELLTETRNRLLNDKVTKENQYLASIKKLNEVLLSLEIEYGQHLDELNKEQTYE